MRSRRKFALVLAACVLFFGEQILAEPEVTFKVLATFDYPGALETSPGGINESGEVVGSFVNELGYSQGFIRFADGTFSDPIVYPGAQSTYLSDINNTGIMCGSYTLGDGIFHGFFLSGSTFTNFDLHTRNTYIRGVNDAGNFCGTTIDQGFVSIDGIVTMFAIPKQAIVEAYGINNLNQAVGGAVRYPQIEYSFRRDPDGRFVWPIRAPGFANTGVFGVDDKGRMVGFVTQPDTYTQAVLVRPLYRFDVFAYPGAILTEFNDINTHGQICGKYDSPDGKSHGLIVLVRGND